MNLTNVSIYRNQQKHALIKKNYAEIYTHELAHKRAGGSLAGNIVIEKNREGIPIGGHVPIKVPVLNKNNPNETIEQANIVIKSAMAPNNPSSQDYHVANQAKNIKSQAENIKRKNRLDYYAWWFALEFVAASVIFPKISPPKAYVITLPSIDDIRFCFIGFIRLWAMPHVAPNKAPYFIPTLDL